ncbi:hypothetical protein BH11BAC3_BH11BAC3_04770 [soil metagenome]
MIKFLISVIAIFMFSSFLMFPEKAQDPFRQLNKLEGTWMMKTGKGIIGESWKKINDRTLQCKGFMIKEGDTINTENVQLIKNKEGIFYIPTVTNQNNQQPVTFQLTSSANNEFVFENPQHDFPKRVVYQLISNDSLIAWIDGGNEQAGSRKMFNYKRVE